MYTDESTCGSVKTVSPHQATDSPRSAGSVMSTSSVPIGWLMVHDGHWHHHIKISDTAVPTVMSSGQAHMPVCSPLTAPQPACVPPQASTRRATPEQPRWVSTCQGQKGSGEKVSEVGVIKQSSSFFTAHGSWVTPKPPRSEHPVARSLISSWPWVWPADLLKAVGLVSGPSGIPAWRPFPRVGMGGTGQLKQDGLTQICTLVEKTLSTWEGLFKEFILNWRIFVLQYCVGFFHIITWISRKYIRVLSLWTTPCSPLPPFQTVTGCCVQLSVWYSTLPLAPYFAYGTVCFQATLSVHLTFSFPAVSKVYSLCLCPYSCPANRFISTIFLDSMYMC